MISNKGGFILIKESILESIDSINDTSLDAEIAVVEAMVASFEKYTLIMENYDGDIGNFDYVVQEGKVLDDVKKKGKKDSNKLVTVLMFIPRLIKALCDIIKKKIDKSTGDKVKEAGKQFDQIKDKKEKQKKVEEINKKLDGKAECYFDEKSGKLKFKKDPHSVINTLAWLATTTVTTSKVFDKIKEEFDVTNPTKIRTFIDDLDAAVHGNQDVSKADLFEGGLEAAGDALGHIAGISAVMAMTAKDVENMADKLRMKDMLKDNESEKKQEILKNVSELSSKMTKVNGMIAGAIGAVSLAIDSILLVFGIGKDTVNKTKEDIKNQEKDLYDAYDRYITDDFKKKHPKMVDKKTGKPESDGAYLTRLRGIVANEHSEQEIMSTMKDVTKARKEKEKADAKAEHDKAVEEYKQKKLERRNQGKKKEGEEDNG